MISGSRHRAEPSALLRARRVSTGSGGGDRRRALATGNSGMCMTPSSDGGVQIGTPTERMGTHISDHSPTFEGEAHGIRATALLELVGAAGAIGNVSLTSMTRRTNMNRAKPLSSRISAEPFAPLARLRIRRSWGALAITFAAGALIGACDGATEPSSSSEQSLTAALTACHLNDGTVDHSTEIRACTPAEETHKTTICHIPPGNPSNEHTLCVGTPAVPAHLQHGDYLGPCKTEQPCPPPGAPTGTGGTTGGGTGGATTSGTGGTSGPGTGGAAGPGTGGSIQLG
jgi:hypothetical protein